jgi:hypothetical protein
MKLNNTEEQTKPEPRNATSGQYQGAVISEDENIGGRRKYVREFDNLV